MLRAAGAKQRRAVVALALVAAFGGCGGDEFANDPRAAPAVTVGAVVTVKGVTVSPARVGAGAVELLASNQTSRSQRVLLRSVRLAHGGTRLSQSTGPINPGGAASLQADLAEGTYVVSVRSSAIEPTTLVVGAPRASGSDKVLQP
jgi:hypothetical protein